MSGSVAGACLQLVEGDLRDFKVRFRLHLRSLFALASEGSEQQPRSR